MLLASEPLVCYSVWYGNVELHKDLCIFVSLWQIVIIHAEQENQEDWMFLNDWLTLWLRVIWGRWEVFAFSAFMPFDAGATRSASQRLLTSNSWEQWWFPEGISGEHWFKMSQRTDQHCYPRDPLLFISAVIPYHPWNIVTNPPYVKNHLYCQYRAAKNSIFALLQKKSSFKSGARIELISIMLITDWSGPPNPLRWLLTATNLLRRALMG